MSLARAPRPSRHSQIPSMNTQLNFAVLVTGVVLFCPIFF